MSHIENTAVGRIKRGERRSLDLPAPTVMAGGMGDAATHQVVLAGVPAVECDVRSHSSLPHGRYRVPSMAVIAALPPNGFVVASTFSGCGGSSLGYRMAGFRVAFASEFIPAARAVYRLNCAPSTYVDPRDIRRLSAADLLDAIGMEAGALDLLDGSPPCASFSTAGKREAGWGQVKGYSGTRQRTDDLFHEFARLVAGVRPRAFVAENVSGLVKGAAKGYFLEILAALKACGYRVEARLLDAQWLGVPQSRQRLIFQGVRSDLIDRRTGRPLMPAFPKPLAARYSVRDALPWVDAVKHSAGDWRPSDSGPCCTIVGSGANTSETAEFSGGTYIEARPEPEPESTIEGYAIGREYDRTPIGGGNDTYFQLKRAHPGRPSPTITASCGQPGTAGVCHPTERRKFSIAELRRICGFPDDFRLAGSYAQQWERLGRAVPPVMMSHIAAAVRDEVLCQIRA